MSSHALINALLLINSIYITWSQTLDICRSGNCYFNDPSSNTIPVCTNTATSCTVDKKGYTSGKVYSAAPTTHIICKGIQSCKDGEYHCGNELPPDYASYNLTQSDFDGTVTDCYFDCNNGNANVCKGADFHCKGDILQCRIDTSAGESCDNAVLFCTDITNPSGTCSWNCDGGISCDNTSADCTNTMATCSRSGSSGHKVTIVTSAPTKSPTQRPTIPPTVYPTKYPTGTPTTSTPTTSNPTIYPTYNPTIQPTFIPTKTPTNLPTIPTNLPTIPPTNLPTIPPTNLPTIPPTHLPTIPPTNLPTIPPTHLPTIPPTHLPTNLPTNVPTKNPTEIPTKIPTGESAEYADTVTTGCKNIGDCGDTLHTQTVYLGMTQNFFFIVIGCVVVFCCILLLLVIVLNNKKHKKMKNELKNLEKTKSLSSNDGDTGDTGDIVVVNSKNIQQGESDDILDKNGVKPGVDAVVGCEGNDEDEDMYSEHNNTKNRFDLQTLNSLSSGDEIFVNETLNDTKPHIVIEKHEDLDDMYKPASQKTAGD